jgi:hypothetical protein
VVDLREPDFKRKLREAIDERAAAAYVVVLDDLQLRRLRLIHGQTELALVGAVLNALRLP